MKRKIWLVLAACLAGCLLCAPVALADPEELPLSDADTALYGAEDEGDAVSAEFVIPSQADDETLGAALKYASSIGARYAQRTAQDFTLSVDAPVGGHAAVVTYAQTDEAGNGAPLSSGWGSLSLTRDAGTTTLAMGGPDSLGISRAASLASNPDALAAIGEPVAIVREDTASWISPSASDVGAGGDATLDRFLKFDGDQPVTLRADNLDVPVNALVAVQVGHRAGQRSGLVLDWQVKRIASDSEETGDLMFVGSPAGLAVMPQDVLDLLMVAPQADGSLKVSADVANTGLDVESSLVFQAVTSPYAVGATAYVIICPEGMEENLVAFLADGNSLAKLRGDIVTVDARGEVFSAKGAAGNTRPAGNDNVAAQIAQGFGIPLWNLLLVAALAVLLVILLVLNRRSKRAGQAVPVRADDAVATDYAAAGDAAEAQGGNKPTDSQPEAGETAEEEPAEPIRPSTSGPMLEESEDLIRELKWGSHKEDPTPDPVPLYDPEADRAAEEEYQRALQEFRHFREHL